MRGVVYWILLWLPVLPLAQAADSAFVALADGFDFPVGKPDAAGYYKFRGYRPGGHLGEDWNGMNGGDTDLGDPVYSIGRGIVVFARDVRRGWGNVVIIRHAYFEAGQIHYIDSLYGHLDRIGIREGQAVGRGSLVGTIGNNRGMYSAHLHFEIRKNLRIGINRSAFGQGLDNYWDPTKFISTRRSLSNGGKSTQVAINTFDSQKEFAEPSNGRAPVRRSPEGSDNPGDSRPRRNWSVDRFGDIILN